MNHAPISEETHAELVRLQELLRVGSDDVVGLALAGLRLTLEGAFERGVAEPPVATLTDLHAAVELVLEHGARWVQIAHDGRRARAQLAIARGNA